MEALSLPALMAAARALLEAHAHEAQAESALTLAQAHTRCLREETIPGAMLELGVEQLTLDTGQRLTLKQDVYASIPKAGKEAAYAWLTKGGFDGLIKTIVSVEFGKGDLPVARRLHEHLTRTGFPAALLSQDIHASTLKAFLREQLATGQAVPLELFGAWPIFTATLKETR